MLTLKQIETFNQLKAIIANNGNELSAIENQYLLSGIRSIQAGDDFVTIIHDLNLKFINLEKRGIKLNESIEQLTKNLTKKYGDPNLVYSGYGRYAGWRRIDDPVAGRGTLRSLLMPVLQVTITYIVVGLIFFNPLIPQIKEQFGEFGYIIFNIVVVLFYLMWLLVTGSLKKPIR